MVFEVFLVKCLLAHPNKYLNSSILEAESAGVIAHANLASARARLGFDQIKLHDCSWLGVNSCDAARVISASTLQIIFARDCTSVDAVPLTDLEVPSSGIQRLQSNT